MKFHQPAKRIADRPSQQSAWFLAVFLTAWTALAPAASSPAAAEITDLNRTNLLAYVNETGQLRPVQTVEHWLQRRAAILQAMQQVMGPLPNEEKKVPLDIQIVEETDCGSYIRRFLTYASEPNSRVPAYLLIPKSALQPGAKTAGILCLHQTHAQGQRVVVGLGNSPNDAYGVELAERGFVCLAPAYPLLANYAPDLPALGYVSGTMKAIWDNIRGLDLLESLPFIHPGNFGAIGHSLGGHNSIYTAVFDQRIRAVASSCGFDSFHDYMNGNIKGWTSVRYMPKLLEYPLNAVPFDFPELIAALAPRPFFASAPLGDDNFKWRSVQRVTGLAAQIYNLYGAPDRLRVEHPDCAHLFPKEMREISYQMFARHLLPQGPPKR